MAYVFDGFVEIWFFVCSFTSLVILLSWWWLQIYKSAFAGVTLYLIREAMLLMAMEKHNKATLSVMLMIHHG